METDLGRNLEDLEKLFQSRMQEYEDKLQKVAAGTAPVHTDLAPLSSEFNDFKKFAWKAIALIKSQIYLLSMGQDRLETSSRRKVLLLHGVPEKQNENVQDTVLHVLADKMALTDVTLANIAVCHRLGAARGKTRPILVRFVAMEHRHLVWDNKTSLKGSGITVSEFLTKMRHQAFTTARQHFGIKNCWTVEGKILVLLPDKTRRKIESMAEVQELIAAHPSSGGEENAGSKAGGATELSPKASTSKASKAPAKQPAAATAPKTRRR